MGTDFASLAGALEATVEKDLTAVGQRIHDEWTTELDNLRTALPGITGQAHSLIDALAAKLIQSGEAHLASIRAHFGLPDPATGEPTAPPNVPAGPVDPTQAPTGAPVTPTDSSTVSTPPSVDSASVTTPPTTETPGA